jgi:hypothetical protein
MRPTRTLCLIFVSAITAMAAGDDPFVGKWKLNNSQSDFTGETFRLEDAGNGKIRYSGGGQTYWFTTDGVEHPGLFGRMVTVKQVDDHTLNIEYRFKGRLTSTCTASVAADGSTETRMCKYTRPDGSQGEETIVDERLGGGTGFLGTWKTRKTDDNTEEHFDIAANGTDGWLMRIPEMKATCALKLDGKDYPAEGPNVAPGMTLAATRAGDVMVQITEKIKGKPVYNMTYKVSDDGRTLTSTGWVPGVDEKTKAVFDKQ